MSPVHILPEEGGSHELIEVLTGLLEAAKSGGMNGIVFGASFRGQRYYCDAAGTLHRNNVVALGVAGMLWAKIERGVRTESQETVF
jgi:hypothetical protein